MNIVYHSENYYVVEYPVQQGFEVVDKTTHRGTFFQGDVALKFRAALMRAVSDDASAEHVDEFLASFDVLLNLPAVYH